MRHEPRCIDVGVPEKETFIEIEPMVDPVPRETPTPAPRPRPIKVPKREPVPA